MKHPETARRLREAMAEKGMIAQELSDKSGVKKASISQYINGSHKPSNQSSGAMGIILDVSPLWLMGFDVEKRISKLELYGEYAKAFRDYHASEEPCKMVTIPVVRRVAAGIPLTSFDEVIDYISIPEETASKGTYFALKIKGDSMSPTINDGDVVVCRQQPNAEDGQIVVAIVNGDDGVCKRLRKYPDGNIALVSDNTAYQPMYFSVSEIDSTPVSVMGIVQELRRKF